MKKVLAMMIVAAFVTTMVSCNKNNQSKEELIVGKWDVQTYHCWLHDFTMDTYEDATYTPATDTNYRGYDAAEFYSDGTTRWHMSDLYVHDGMYTEPYRHFEWRNSGDSLFVSTNWFEGSVLKYAIKELNNETLVIEQYTNNGHPEYSHHHLEQTQCYTFKRTR
ncbi:MAG: hypothetical protein J6P83_02880 [Bacteroidales bacterium]|nr:hypothetical protein [Bacteroidales bacterium]